MRKGPSYREQEDGFQISKITPFWVLTFFEASPIRIVDVLELPSRCPIRSSWYHLNAGGNHFTPQAWKSPIVVRLLVHARGFSGLGAGLPGGDDVGRAARLLAVTAFAAAAAAAGTARRLQQAWREQVWGLAWSTTQFHDTAFNAHGFPRRAPIVSRAERNITMSCIDFLPRLRFAAGGKWQFSNGARNIVAGGFPRVVRSAPSGTVHGASKKQIAGSRWPKSDRFLEFLPDRCLCV